MTIASIIFRLRDQRLRGFAADGFLVADVWRRFTLELWGGYLMNLSYLAARQAKHLEIREYRHLSPNWLRHR